MTLEEVHNHKEALRKDWATIPNHSLDLLGISFEDYLILLLSDAKEAQDQLNKEAILAYRIGQSDNSRLLSEIREFKLLVREYFQAKSLMTHSTNVQMWKDRHDDFEKRILSELEAFTLQEQNELPFKD